MREDDRLGKMLHLLTRDIQYSSLKNPVTKILVGPGMTAALNSRIRIACEMDASKRDVSQFMGIDISETHDLPPFTFELKTLF